MRRAALFLILGALTPFAPAAFAQAPAAPAGPPPYASPCDRACLTMAGEQMIQALLVNDASRLPLAPGFRYTENGQKLVPGEGLWGTLSAYAGEDARLAPAAAALVYRVTVADPERGEIGLAVETDENRTKGVLTLRLKVVDGRIAEAQALVVREEFGGARGGTVSLFQPPLLTTMDGELVEKADPLFTDAGSPMPADRMIAAANAYFDAIDANRSAGVPFAADCIRRDNGVRTTGRTDAKPLDPGHPAYIPFALGCAAQIDSGFYSNIEGIRERQFVADAAHGVLLAYASIDVPGTVLSIRAKGKVIADYPGPREPGSRSDQQFQASGPNMIAPTTHQTATLFRFVDGKIARIDIFARGAPYGVRSGWETK